uniref:Calcium homeostasis modulator 3 n=1 Tax=Oncorhynchus kisutch TaxID=8019 RepID=A0A8C7F875_ONCKI
VRTIFSAVFSVQPCIVLALICIVLALICIVLALICIVLALICIVLALICIILALICIVLALICIVLALIKWLRPIGKRSKDHAIYMFSAMMHRALLAPMVWILVTLLDGKIFICAFGMSVDPKPFSGMPDNTGLDLEDLVFRNITFRKAVSRYVRCYSQAIGWSIFLFFIILGALGRLIKSCFNDHATNLRTCVLRFCPQVRGAVFRGHAGRRSARTASLTRSQVQEERRYGGKGGGETPWDYPAGTDGSAASNMVPV